MSLINDALKKAQRQRTEGNPSPAETTGPSTTPEQLHRIARREKPAGFRSQLILVGGGAVAAVVLLGIGAMFFFRSGEQPAAKPAQVAVAPAPAVTAPVTQPSATTPVPAPAPSPSVAVALPPAQNPAPASIPAPTPTPPIASPIAPVQPSNQFVLPSAPTAVSAPIAANAPTVAAPAAVDRPKPSTRMIGVIEHFRVGGIRVSGAESKVLMNDKVYRINDIVDFELGIRLTAIETKALTFEDARGAIHIRTF